MITRNRKPGERVTQIIVYGISIEEKLPPSLGTFYVINGIRFAYLLFEFGNKEIKLCTYT